MIIYPTFINAALTPIVLQFIKSFESKNKCYTFLYNFLPISVVFHYHISFKYSFSGQIVLEYKIHVVFGILPWNHSKFCIKKLNKDTADAFNAYFLKHTKENYHSHYKGIMHTQTFSFPYFNEKLSCCM